MSTEKNIKWQVCSVGDMAGTEVLGIVEAENDQDAAIKANQKFQSSYSGEDIIVRPMDDKTKVKVASYGSDRPDIYEFEAEDTKWAESTKDRMAVHVTREHMLKIIEKAIYDGFNSDKDVFCIEFVGKLQFVREM